jgi:hypothetical protein
VYVPELTDWLDVFTALNAGPPVIFGVVTAPAAMSSVVITPSGNPPAVMPVTVPDPLIEIGMVQYLTG